MSHPLLGDLSALSMDELQNKYFELTKRLNQAYRLGYGDAVQQLNMILADYQAEINTRSQKALQDAIDKSPEFKNIIDIG